MVDAHAVAAAVEADGGAIVTGDDTDLERLALAAPYPNLHVTAVHVTAI